MLRVGDDSYPSEHNNWHALFVLTGQEEHIKKMLEYRLAIDKIHNIRAVVPQRRLRERKGGDWFDTVRVLFPGYILLNGSIGASEYYRIKDIAGIIRLLRNDQELLYIRPGEIETISKLVCNSDIIGYSKVLMEGGMVRVIDGPLLSMEGCIQSIDSRKSRAKVRLSFLGEHRTVDLGVDMIKAIQ